MACLDLFFTIKDAVLTVSVIVGDRGWSSDRHDPDEWPAPKQFIHRRWVFANWKCSLADLPINCEHFRVECNCL